jgi:hypothetical protein
MVSKWGGLGYGSLIFLVLFFIAAALISQYVFNHTKVRSQAADNRK